MKPAPTEPDLTFSWPVEKGFPFVLFGCVAGSLFAHAATFFLFQVVYPQRVTIPQPSPHVSLLTPTTPENIALLRWIEAEDPALIAGDDSVVPPTPSQVRYQPSFATPQTMPLSAPVEKPLVVPFPPAVGRLKLEKSKPLDHRSAPATSTNADTAVRFASTLAKRSLLRNPAFKPPHRTATPISPTVLLIGVHSDGQVRYQFLQQSSGDSTFDDMALAHLGELQFAPAPAEMTWSHVTVAWGADVYTEGSGAVATPEPQ